MVKLVAALLGAGCFLLTVSGFGDFDLSDALGTVTMRPNPATKRPPVGDNPRPHLYPDLQPHAGGHGSDGGNSRPNLYPDLKPHGGYGNDDSDFNLGDALGGGSSSIGGGGGGGGGGGSIGGGSSSGGHGSIGGHDFSDLDLNDGKPLPPAGERPHISDQGGNTVDSSSAAQITSPVVAVVVLLAVGALAGYTSYKQKRYCFKPRGGAVV